MKRQLKKQKQMLKRLEFFMRKESSKARISRLDKELVKKYGFNPFHRTKALDNKELGKLYRMDIPPSCADI